MAHHVLGSAEPAPEAQRVVYVDGSAPPSAFRPGVDLELSHWVPTSTPERWAADTSTETCLRFLADPPDDAGEYGLAVNNHVDVDGILSVFCLAHPDVALAHRASVVGAAEMGDLSAGVGWPAFRLAQELTVLMGGFRGPGRDPLATYDEAFARIPAILADADPAPEEVRRCWEVLEAQAAVLAAGEEVQVDEVGPRLVGFTQRSVAGAWDAQVRIAPFNALVDDSVWLWPHVRNRRHGEALHLVSTEAADGWAHDLWLPGYVWAHTPDRWRPPILEGTGDSNTWRIRTEVLAEAVAALRADERGPGTWALAEEVDAFASLRGRAFPVILSCVDGDGAPVPSSQTPARVVARLAPALAGG
jgi:hypothetical protein